MAVLAACSGGSGGGEKASPKTSPPSSSNPPPTIDLSKPIPGGSLHGTPRPPLENTGTDYVAIFKSLDATVRWFSENPDPALMSEVYVPGTQGHDSRVSAYRYLVDNGYRWADEAYQLLTVEVVDANGDAVSLRIRDNLEFERVVDAAGSQVGTIRPREPATKEWNVLLSRDATGRWRIADWSQVGGGAVEL
ncbi:MAG TPA: hypothetical protein VHY55_08550 [Acidimicrobiia bacterium]|nr:hypothetical protein [Acidimicrobiia bacterium]